MTATDSQLCAVTALRSEIEGIDRTVRVNAVSGQAQSSMSYSFGVLSDVSSLTSVNQAVAEIASSVRELLAKLAPVYTLEISREGMTVRSVIQYTGKVVSVWGQQDATASTAAEDLAAEHQVVLEKTYALRIAFVGAIAAAGSTLIAISVAVANPLTALHALASATALKLALDRLAAAVATHE